MKRTQNLSSGRYAVACVGSRQWMRESAIGDGITAATMALVTRCETHETAREIAQALNDAQPAILPGQGFAWVYEAVLYRRNDYIGQQNIDREQTRDCDRRISPASILEGLS
jgi:hypothetical protein